MSNKFTEKAEASLNRAVKLAERFGHTYIGSEHILLALSEDEECCASVLMKSAKLTFDKIYNAVKDFSGKGEKSALTSKDTTPRCRRILENSYKNSRKFSSERIGTEHILLSILEERESVASKILLRCNVDIVSLKDEVVTFLRTSERNIAFSEPLTDSMIPNLTKYGRNMTKIAEEDGFDPVIGRDKETERIIRILSRKTKNNPCLIGEAGVGKTAIVEGLAKRISEGKVPPSLIGKTVISVDLTSMVAGAKYRGDFEERIKSIMNEAAKNKSVILFIDEIHSIVGAGAAEGAIDASNIMKPELARGEIRVIGATTVTEYRKYIEKDSALERRFQPVMIEEPTTEKAIDIIKGLKERYEKHHGLRISDDAIRSSVLLSKRYLQDRYLPDKAIDLLDEACALCYAKRDKSEEREQNPEQSLLSRGNPYQSRASAITDELGMIERNYSMELSSAKEIIRGNHPEITVTEKEVAEVIKEITGIDAKPQKASSAGSIYDNLMRRIVGQDKAVKSLSEAVARSLAGINDPRRPRGIFLFLGESGVGKTELSRALANELFCSEDALIRYDMSEYSEPSSVSKLIGSAPGYVGYEEAGSALEKIRRRPYSVILFDEIEKAHPDVISLFLQIFDNGSICDGAGRRISFKDSYIILTSNIGNDNFKGSGLGFIENEGTDHLYNKLRPYFKDEFINRIDEIILFSSLDSVSLTVIAQNQLDSIVYRVRERGFCLEFTPDVATHYGNFGRTKGFGARPLKRMIVHEIESLVAEFIIEGRVSSEDKLVISLKDGKPIADIRLGCVK